MDPSPRRRGNGAAAPAALGVTVTPGVCAAICTRDRTDRLRRALRSLMGQTREPAEILVVDNAPGGPATRSLVRDEFPGVRYVMEPVPGLDFARNRALRETSREIVAFMDDDVVAGPGWAGAILDVFRESERIAICTGKVEALSLETEGQRLFEANGGFARGEERIRLPADRKRRLHGVPVPLIAWSIGVGSGCSLAVRRRTILDLGGFDEALDLGHPLPGGGDLDILWRVLDAGYEIVYDPAVQARHEHRREVEAFREPDPRPSPVPDRHAREGGRLPLPHGPDRRARLPRLAPDEAGGAAPFAACGTGPASGMGSRPDVGELLAGPGIVRRRAPAGGAAAECGIRPGRGGGGRMKRTPILVELWRFRGLLRSLVVRDLKVKYQRSLLGLVWTLLNPLLDRGDPRHGLHLCHPDPDRSITGLS